jgi:Tfp pilus assembly protein PilF
MKFRSLALATAGLLALTFASFAQVTAIEGVVKGADGKPVQGAWIRIHRTDIKGEYPVKTDKKGHYIYTGLPIGMYNVACEIDGKQVDMVKGVKTSPGDPMPINFDLHAARSDNASKQQMMQKAVQTGEIPKELEKSMTPEQKAAMEKQIKEQEARMKKNAALNQAYNDGLAALTAKQYDVAIENLNKAAELDPTQLAVWSHLAEAYQSSAVGPPAKTGPDFDTAMGKALEAYQKALALKPDDAGLHNNYGLALAKDKKFPEAQAELQKAAELDPPNGGKYYYNLGALLVNAGQNVPASEAFKKAIEVQPNYADAYYQYGVMLVAKAAVGADGKVTPVPGTIEALQKYLELAPTGANAQAAKDMLTTLGSTVDTQYKNPDANKKKKKN